MTGSHSGTYTTTFTYAHAVHIAAKVATDLKRIQRLYGNPTDEWIRYYKAEAIEFLKAGYLGTVTYGFKRNGCWIEPTLRYTARDLSDNATNDADPGRIRPGALVDGAYFTSYLIHNSAFDQLTQLQREEFYRLFSNRRIAGLEPNTSGYWREDLTYSAGSRALDRASLRN